MKKSRKNLKIKSNKKKFAEPLKNDFSSTSYALPVVGIQGLQ